MKITEICVGNYVYNKDNELCKVCVVDLRTNSVIVDNYAHDDGTFYEYSIEEVKPVPLTAEILEKNDFRKDLSGSYCNSDDFHDIDIKEYSDSIWYVRIEDTEFTMPTEACSVSYVHQLQNFLRNCGIEKEVKL